MFPSDTEFDIIELDIQWQRLISIMDEVDNAVIKTSFSARSWVRATTSPASSWMQTVASLCQSSFSPPDFCVILPRTARAMLERFPVETLQEGDVLVTNDPWLAAGHLPDYASSRQCSIVARWLPSWGPSRTCRTLAAIRGDILAGDVFTEGVRVPPAKLYEAGARTSCYSRHRPELPRAKPRAGRPARNRGTHQVGARGSRSFSTTTTSSTSSRLSR